MQAFDLTTLRAVHADLRAEWLPARLETLVQTDLWTVHLGLRTLSRRGWMTVCWHPQVARLHLGSPPGKGGEVFQFAQALQRLRGLALVAMVQPDPWERVLEWQWAARPGGEVQWRLILEIMGKYSNAILVDPQGLIVACGHGVSERQSRLRPVQVGIPYTEPPPLLGAIPTLEESLAAWQERLQAIPGPWGSRLLKTYRGVSPSLVQHWSRQTGIPVERGVEQLLPGEWEQLFEQWRAWLGRLQGGEFLPCRTEEGYSLLGGGDPQPLHGLLEGYYEGWRQGQIFQQQRQSLGQKLRQTLAKRQQRRQEFLAMLQEAEQAEQYRYWADLLMAHAHQDRVGLETITLADFASGDPVEIPLQPDKSLIGNAELYYKRCRKGKRARQHLQPLLAALEQEITYLESVELLLADLDSYRDPQDLETLQELEQELSQQGYGSGVSRSSPPPLPFRQFHTPQGIPIWVGRSNRHNDQLTFRHAQRHHWWFHAQEIPGSHVVLGLQPGQVAEAEDLQIAADLAAYFSRARHSQHVPVVYTRPYHVRKPKGSPPGTVIYEQEQVIWASPGHPRLRGILAQEDQLPMGRVSSVQAK
ncbi:MAG: NFACT RNA binding domain-containing protein [Thermostichales cyanobacterium BF4_bins_65]